MPSKNSIKSFAEDQMWHIYNRGTDKRLIFTEDKDFAVFLSYIKCCLREDPDDADKLETISHLGYSRYRRLDLSKEVKLVSYCLMPNHFHLQLFQYSPDGISKLMRSIMTGYVAYFNHKEKRTGHLFQGVYKGSLVSTQDYWDHLSRYIHLNPTDINKPYKNYDFSSYKYYTKKYDTPEWLAPEFVLDSFKRREYEQFVEDYIDYKKVIKDPTKVFLDLK